MARSKYNEEIKKTILDAIRKHGSDVAGIKAGHISVDTFYRWINIFPEFSEGIRKAKAEYRSSIPDEWVQQAKKAFEDYLFGRAVEDWHSEKVVFDGDKEVIERSHRTVRRGVPAWVIERVLGTYKTLEAMQELLSAGVATEDQASIVRDGIADIEAKLQQIKAMTNTPVEDVAGDE